MGAKSKGPSLSDYFSKSAQWASWHCGRAHTFIIAILLIVVWAAFGPAFHYSDTWQLVVNTGTTIVTFLMVFLIQNTQNRDTAAMQLKLDELIRASNARNRLLSLEDLAEEDLKRLKASLRGNKPLRAIQEPLNAAQESLADAAEGIEAAHEPLPDTAAGK